MVQMKSILLQLQRKGIETAGVVDLLYAIGNYYTLLFEEEKFEYKAQKIRKWLSSRTHKQLRREATLSISHIEINHVASFQDLIREPDLWFLVPLR